jgi:hypothetical protein
LSNAEQAWASKDFAGPVNTIRATRLPGEQIKNEGTNSSQNVPSTTRVAAGAFGFLIFSHAFDGPDSYGPAFGGAASHFMFT